jgi:DNA-binding transcriptional ArsR family regulator
MARLATTTDVFNAVAEPQRREILNLLAHGERSVNEIAAVLNLKQPQVSKHLRVLSEVDLVTVRKDGKQRLYRLRSENLKPIHEWVSSFEHIWNERLDRLEVYLNQLQNKEQKHE